MTSPAAHWPSVRARRIGTHGHEVVGATYLNAVTSIVEKRDVGSYQLIAEFLQNVFEAGFVEINLRRSAYEHESKFPQRVGH